MSFLNITDPKKRDSIVDDCLVTVKRLQHRDINERAQDLVREGDLNRMFEPVVKSTGKSTQAIRDGVKYDGTMVTGYDERPTQMNYTCTKIIEQTL